MQKKTILAAPDHLLAFYLPGLEMAARLLEQQITQIRNVASGADVADVAPVRAKRNMTPEGRERISKAVKAHWTRVRRARAKAPTVRVSGQNGTRSATPEEILAWGREHGGLFDTNEFSAAHPNVGMRALGLLVRHGAVKKKGAQKGVFQLTSKGERAQGAPA